MNKTNFRNFFRFELGSVLLILFGAVLLMNPDFGSAAVASILGWVLVIAGAAGLIVSFAVLSAPDLTGLGTSFLLLVVGIYLLRRPLMLASLIGLFLGLLLLTQGLGSLRDGLQLRHYGGGYRLSLLLGIGMSVLGIVLILSPMTTSRFVMRMAGFVMVVCGISNLISRRRNNKFITASRKKIIGQPNIIDADL